MQLRGELTYSALGLNRDEVHPFQEREGLPYHPDDYYINEELYNPENGEHLAQIRAHCMSHPEGILLDVYQSVTELGLKYPSGTMEAQRKFLDGLREEVGELHSELLTARMEHPYGDIIMSTEGPEDTWIMSVLDPNKLQFRYLNPDRKDHTLGELGDVLWYSSRVAAERGFSLSESVLTFLRHENVGALAIHDLNESRGFGLAGQPSINERAGEIMDLELIQSIALSVPRHINHTMNRGTPLEQTVTIESMPSEIFGSTHDLRLHAAEGLDTWEPENPYTHLPDLKYTIGKLVLATAHTAHSVLNADFATVMQANLQKISARSRRKTVFDKSDRSEADESPIKAHTVPRMPMR